VADSPDVSMVEELMHSVMVMFHDWVHPFAHASGVVGVFNVLEGASELSIEVSLDGLSDELGGLVDILSLEGWAVFVTVLFSVASSDAGDKETGGEFHIEYFNRN